MFVSRFALMRGFLRSPEPGEPGGGGGEPPKYVTEEQLNKAITGKLGEFSKKLNTQLETAIGGVTTALTAKLDEAFTGLKESLPKPPEPGAGGDGAPKLREEEILAHPLFKGMKKQVDTLQKRAEESDVAATRLAAQQKDMKLREAAKEQLVKSGITAQNLNKALAYLVDGEKRIRYSEDGDSIVFRDEDDAELDLKSGVKAWAKSDDAQIYLPPRGTKGSGHQPGQGGSGGGGTKGGPRLGTILQNALLEGGPAFSESEDE